MMLANRTCFFAAVTQAAAEAIAAPCLEYK